MLWGDKIFWSITIFCLFGLFWIRFLEWLLPVEFSLLISIPIAIYIFRLENPVKLREKEKMKLFKEKKLDNSIHNGRGNFNEHS